MNPTAVVVGLAVGLACGVTVSPPGRPTWHLALAGIAAAVIAALITGALT